MKDLNLTEQELKNLTEQDLVEKGIFTEQELDNIRNIIERNMNDSENNSENVVYELDDENGNWHSADGISFQIERAIGNRRCMFEVTSNTFGYCYDLDEEMNKTYSGS